MEQAEQRAPSTSFDVFLSEVKRRKVGARPVGESSLPLGAAESAVLRVLSSGQPELAQDTWQRSALQFFDFTEAIDDLVTRGLILRVDGDQLQLSEPGAAAVAVAD